MKIHEFINDYCRNCGVHYNSVFNECIGASGSSMVGGNGCDGKLDGLGGGNFGVLSHVGGVIGNCEEMVSVRKKDLDSLKTMAKESCYGKNFDNLMTEVDAFLGKYLKEG